MFLDKVYIPLLCKLTKNKYFINYQLRNIMEKTYVFDTAEVHQYI
nr:MAG TPA: hypothetical protein [Crassvirales sp.]